MQFICPTKKHQYTRLAVQTARVEDRVRIGIGLGLVIRLVKGYGQVQS